MKRFLCAIIIISIFVCSVSVSFAAELPLKDISKHWAKDNIMYLYNQRLVGGYPDGTYKPDNPVNLVEFLKLATLGIGYKLESGHYVWYENYLNKAIELGLIDKDKYPNVTAPITREEIAAIAVKAVLQNEEKPSQELDEMINMNIRDISKVSNDKKQYVIDAYRIGLMAGNPDGFFKPQDTLTRAEMCTVIIRIMDKTKRQPFDPANNYAIKLNNVYSGEPYIIARPEKKEEIGLAYAMLEAQKKNLGWYCVSYYPDIIGSMFYANFEEFQNDLTMHAAFSNKLYAYNNLTPSYTLIVYMPRETKQYHREAISAAFKYLFQQDYDKVMALYDKCLEDSIIGTAKKSSVNYTFNNRKLNIYRESDGGQFEFNIYKKVQ